MSRMRTPSRALPMIAFSPEMKLSVWGKDSIAPAARLMLPHARSVRFRGGFVERIGAARILRRRHSVTARETRAPVPPRSRALGSDHDGNETADGRVHRHVLARLWRVRERGVVGRVSRPRHRPAGRGARL